MFLPPKPSGTKSSPVFSYKIGTIEHGNHVHFELTEPERLGAIRCSDKKCTATHTKKQPDKEENSIKQSDEGCPCCAVAIDLDEVATATNEIKSGLSNNHHNATGELADFSSAAHWGVFLGISGPLALSGLTAACRNVKGSLDNRKKLNSVRKGLDKDIKSYKGQLKDKSGEDAEKLGGVIDRLEAFRNNLKYSQFDTNFNLVVPGVINGAASSMVMSTAIYSSPFALPAIALYAGCQTARNGYDAYRTFNKKLPDDLQSNISLSQSEGNKKINQITSSKKKFYSTNTAAFAVFAAGAVVTAVAAMATGGIALPIGVALLASGAIATGVTNNIWTNKFKPRNGDLGVNRKELDLQKTSEEVGKRSLEKKLLKTYASNHLKKKPLKYLVGSLISTLPFLQEKGADIRHNANLTRIDKSSSTDTDRLDLLERIINTRKILEKDATANSLPSSPELSTTILGRSGEITLEFDKSNSGNDDKGKEKLLQKIANFETVSKAEKDENSLFSFNGEENTLKQTLGACKELGIDALVINKFIQNSIIGSQHDTRIKDTAQFAEKLTSTNIFKKIGERIVFDADKLEKPENKSKKDDFMKSLEEHLLFDSVENLKYQQYGLNDFYWSLNKQQNKTKSVSEKKAGFFKKIFRKSDSSSASEKQTSEESDGSSKNSNQDVVEQVSRTEIISAPPLPDFLKGFSWCNVIIPEPMAEPEQTPKKSFADAMIETIESIANQTAPEIPAEHPDFARRKEARRSIAESPSQLIAAANNLRRDKPSQLVDSLPYDEEKFYKNEDFKKMRDIEERKFNAPFDEITGSLNMLDKKFTTRVEARKHKWAAQRIEI
jgi:hypothetical protein